MSYKATGVRTELRILQNHICQESTMETEKKTYEIIDGVEKLEAALESVRAAQRIYAKYTQEQVDAIFLAAATAANRARIPLAKMAVEETGMGIVEDKVIKNHYASEYIYNQYRNVKTCGVIEEDPIYGIKKSQNRSALSVRSSLPRIRPLRQSLRR